MSKVHIFGDYYIIESNQNTAVYLTEVQFNILCYHADGFSSEKIFRTLIGNEIYTEEQLHLASSNIDSLINQLINIGVKISRPIQYSGEYGKFYPMILNIELTNQCNFKCSHCYKEADSHKYDFLDMQTIEDLIQMYSGKIKTIHLTGGEPLIYPNFNDLIIRLTDHFNVNITTNGSLLYRIDDSTIRKINNFQISIYGFDENSYNLIANNKQGFNQVIQSLTRLNDLNITYDISVTANQIFIRQFENYFTYLKSKNVKRVLVGLPFLEGRAKTYQKLWTLSDQDMETLQFIEETLGLGQSIDVLKDSFLIESIGKTPFDMCGAGSIMYTINEKGTLLYCTSLSRVIQPLGSIKDIEIRSQAQPFNLRKIIDQIKSKHSFQSPMCPLLGDDNK